MRGSADYELKSSPTVIYQNIWNAYIKITTKHNICGLLFN